MIAYDPVSQVNAWLAKPTPNLGPCPPRAALVAWLMDFAERLPHRRRSITPAERVAVSLAALVKDGLE